MGDTWGSLSVKPMKAALPKSGRRLARSARIAAVAPWITPNVQRLLPNPNVTAAAIVTILLNDGLAKPESPQQPHGAYQCPRIHAPHPSHSRSRLSLRYMATYLLALLPSLSALAPLRPCYLTARA